MKLVMVTVIEEFHNKVLELFKKAEINSFSESDIEGFKRNSGLVEVSNWFSNDNQSVQSLLFFSFTEEHNVQKLFIEIEKFNSTLKTNSPIKAAVLPIEKFI